MGAGHATTETRKVVTVLFADVVGSTNVGERTDPEALRRVMTRYFDEMKAVIERHGGVVEKFIGDAVMAVFGVPVAHEDDALRAVRAAAEIRTHLTAIDMDLQRERGISVAWRTGINTGEVVAGDAGTGQRFVTGDAVNVAARLEQAAGGGEILIGDGTLRLVGDYVVAEPVGSLEVRGRSETVNAHRLVHVGPERQASRRHLSGPMIGRERQSRLLRDAYDQVISDRVCHLFTVLGSAGVGKSRLIAEFAADVGDQATILRGRCLSYGEGITYWPITEVIRDAAGIVETDDQDAVRSKLGSLFEDAHDRAAATERLGEVIGRFEGSAPQEETFWAVRTLLESLCRRRPLILILDDLHWAEPTLLNLIDYVVDWMRDAPLLIVCLARQDLLELRPGWGGGKGSATTITLEPLSDAESRNLVSSLLGREGPGATLDARIAAAAEGNPLFVEEMIGMLIDRGHIVAVDGHWEAVADLALVSVPPTIQALLAARLDALPHAERAVLERGSVEGKVFHRGAVAELAPEAVRASVSDTLRALSRKELVRPEKADFADDEAFRFRHLLIRDAAYSSMPKEARGDLHARFAAWLTRVAGDHVGEYEEILGYHFEQAYRYRIELGPVDDAAQILAAKAVHHLGNSGVRALDRGDNEAARKLLTSATDLAPIGDPARTRLRADLGLALSSAGEVRAADALLVQTIDEAAAAGDELGRARAEVCRIDALSSLGEMSVEEVIDRCQRLLEIFDASGDQRGAERAATELARHHFFAGRAKIGEQILTDRIAQYPPGQAPHMYIRWLPTILAFGPTPIPEASRQIAAVVSTSRSHILSGEALAPLGILKAWLGELDAGREIMQRAIATYNELGLRRYALSVAGTYLGPLEALAGRYEAAEDAVLGSYTQLTEMGDRGFASSSAAGLAQLYVQMARFDDADTYARIAREIATPDDVEAQARALGAAARVSSSRGEHAGAARLARQAVELINPTDYLDLRGETYAEAAEVHAAAGDSQLAIESFELALADYESKGATIHVARVRQRLAAIRAGQ